MSGYPPEACGDIFGQIRIQYECVGVWINQSQV